ncbi:uncharacterized protein LOC106666961 [Cimex lectularius]|uniref:Transposase Helix-turn-helix domain-containing protein n=1 Tax=Cimex lectularius TaxID=79782 RepID=A0A8I6SNR2_CIMLE|nr:uncharacterized protein LOC106666961 [Cimex lectularius]
MASYISNTAEEMRRKTNISRFLEGLLDEDSSDVCGDSYSHYAGSENEPSKIDREFSPLHYLPENELNAYKDYPGLLEANKKSVLKTPFSIHNIEHDDKLVQIYTGIPAAKGFFNLANRFTKNGIKYYSGWVVGQLTIKQQLLMTLMKLKLGMDDIHLSHRFNCSLETVTNTVFTWLLAIHQKLFYAIVKDFGGQRPFTDPVLMDAVTLHIKGPRNPHLPHKTPLEPYTALIVARTDGVVMYAGDIYPWTSDKVDVIEESDFFQSLQEGNVICLDNDVSAVLDIPDGVFVLSFDVGCGELNDIRKDLERRMSEYQAFRCIPPELEGYANVVWQVIVALTNYSKFKAFMA